MSAIINSVKNWFAKAPDTWENHVHPHDPLKKIADNLWIVSGTLPKAPPRNMVIYKMKNGGLFIHSCIAVNEETLNDIKALGEPEILLVPNRFHRADCKVWKEKFPAVKIVSPAGAKAGVEGVIKVESTVEEISADLQQNGIQFLEIKGFKVAELAYVLEVTKDVHAYLITDLLFNLGSDASVMAKIMGAVGDGKVPKMNFPMRTFGISDKQQLKKWFEDLIARTTDADMMIVCHGNIISENLPDILKKTLGNL